MWRQRSLWSATLVVIYIGSAILQRPGATGPSRLVTLAAVASGLLTLWSLWRFVERPSKGLDLVTSVGRRSGKVVATGAAMAVSLLGSPEGEGFQFVGWVALSLVSLGSITAIGHAGSLGGMAAVRVQGHWSATLLMGVVWLVALGIEGVAVAGWSLGPSVGSKTGPFFLLVACLAHLTVSLAASLRLYASRRFELGIAERAAASAWLTVFCLLVGVLAALMEVAAPLDVVPPVTLAAALMTSLSALSQRPEGVGRLLRTSAVVMVLCAPIISLAVVAVFKAPTHAGVIMFGVACASVLAGLMAPRLGRLLAPERSRNERVLGDALRCAKDPDPERAITRVLSVVREGLRSENSAMLFRLTARDVLTVDRAGYLHRQGGAPSPRLLDVIAVEPEGVMGTETLRAVQVHKPEVRPFVTWLDEREAGAAVLIREDDVAVGLLLWPSTHRTSPLGYDEVRGLRHLADHLGAVVGSSAVIERSKASQIAADQIAHEADKRVMGLQQQAERQAARHRSHAERLAAALSVATRSPAAQVTLGELQRVSRRGQPMALVVPVGGHPESWVARVHLASPFADGPLVIVDCSHPREKPLERWSESDDGPVDAALGGTLVLRGAHALPHETQRYIVAALRKETGLVVTVPDTLDALAAAGFIEKNLVDRVGPRQIELPGLASRAEDLGHLTDHQLERIATELGRERLGVSLEARQVISEYHWPGNETEFAAVLLRAAMVCESGDLDAELLESILGSTVVPPAVKR